MTRVIKGKTVLLRYAELDDAEFIYSLRSDPARNRFVSTVSGGAESQRRWLEKYKEREAEGLEHYFIIEKDAVSVGALRIYDLKPDSFCWGSWMMKPGAPRTAALESAVLLYEFAFYELGYPMSHFDVRVSNERVVAFHQRFGAKIAHSTETDHFFEYSRDDYEKIRSKYAKLLSAGNMQ